MLHLGPCLYCGRGGAAEPGVCSVLPGSPCYTEHMSGLTPVLCSNCGMTFQQTVELGKAKPK